MNELQRLLQPQRLQEETYEDYRARRWAANRAVKQALKGRVVWDSESFHKDAEGKQIRTAHTYTKESST